MIDFPPVARGALGRLASERFAGFVLAPPTVLERLTLSLRFMEPAPRLERFVGRLRPVSFFVERFLVVVVERFLVVVLPELLVVVVVFVVFLVVVFVLSPVILGAATLTALKAKGKSAQSAIRSER